MRVFVCTHHTFSVFTSEYAVEEENESDEELIDRRRPPTPPRVTSRPPVQPSKKRKGVVFDFLTFFFLTIILVSDYEFQSLSTGEMIETIIDEANLKGTPSKRPSRKRQPPPVTYTPPPPPKSHTTTTTSRKKTSTPPTTTTTRTNIQTPTTTYKPPSPLPLPYISSPPPVTIKSDNRLMMENRQLLKKIGSLEQRILELEKKNSLLEGLLMARDMVERNHKKELDRIWAVLNNK